MILGVRSITQSDVTITGLNPNTRYLVNINEVTNTGYHSVQTINVSTPTSGSYNKRFDFITNHNYDYNVFEIEDTEEKLYEIKVFLDDYPWVLYVGSQNFLNVCIPRFHSLCAGITTMLPLTFKGE